MSYLLLAGGVGWVGQLVYTNTVPPTFTIAATIKAEEAPTKLATAYATEMPVAEMQETLTAEDLKRFAPENSSPAEDRKDHSRFKFFDLGRKEEDQYKIPVTKINYYRSDWKPALEKAARETEAVLIIHSLPETLLTHTDFTEHTRDEAARILSQELEKEGHRLLIKDQFWTVVSTKTTGLQYPRHVVQQIPATTQAQMNQGQVNTAQVNTAQVNTAQYQPGQYPQNTSEQITPTSATLPQDAAVNRANAPRLLPTGDGQYSRTNRNNGLDSQNNTGAPIKRVNHQEQMLNTVESTSQPATAPMFFRPQNTAVRDIARRIYQISKDRAELVDSGAYHLPAFRVYQPAPVNDAAGQDKTITNQPLLFELGIDMDQNEILVQGDKNVARQVLQLASVLDQHALNINQGVAVMDVKRNAEDMQKEIKPLLDHAHQLQFSHVKPISRPTVQTTQNQWSNNQVAGLFDEQPAATQPQTPPANGSAIQLSPESAEQVRSQLPALLEKLKGDVSVEALPDLNFLILRGNEKDVESVMNMIKAIEDMAVGSVPSIHLHYLKNVNSEALALLLNDVYTQLTTLKNKTNTTTTKSVTVIPVVKPNAVLILAPDSLLDSVVQLTEELDKPVDPSFEVEVFALKNAAATEAQTTIESFYAERPQLGTRIKVTADTRTNSLIIQARPNDLVELAQLVSKIDRDSSDSKAQLQVIRLKFTLAEELATFLNSIVNSVLTPASRNQTGGGGGFGGGGTSQQFQQAKSMILEMLTQNENAQKLVRSGVLADVRITADARSNTLAITATPQSMEFLRELVSILDQPTIVTSEIKIFKLDNADATAAVELLNTLFASDTAATGTVQLAGAENATPLVPVKLSVDVRTNSVVASGGGESLKIVHAILLRLDETGVRQRKTTIYKLRNRPVTDVSEALNTFLEEQRALNEINPDLVSTNELLSQEIIITPEVNTNSLIVSATPQYYDQILKLVENLDLQPAQVMIQGLIVEVTLDDTDELGVELGFQDPVLFTRSSTVGNIPGFNFNNTNALGNNPVDPGHVATQGLGNFGVGRANSSLGFGGLVLSASSDDVSVLIRALAYRRDAKILSRPQVLVTDNQTAQIQVGRQVPIVNGVNITTQGLANPIIIQDQAGIILTVTPRISPEGTIVMETVAEKSAYNGDSVPIYTTGTSTITSPIKDITTARSTISVNDGQTIVMGGMITKSDDTQERKVPWLGDLPLIGKAFRFDTHTGKRTELIIFITPRIINCDGDMEVLKQIEIERLHFFVDQAEAMHGPLYGLPPECLVDGCPPPTIDGQPNMTPIPQNYTTPPTPGSFHPTLEIPPTPSTIPGPIPSPAIPPQTKTNTSNKIQQVTYTEQSTVAAETDKTKSEPKTNIRKPFLNLGRKQQ
jgi:type II secretion system protein D